MNRFVSTGKGWVYVVHRGRAACLRAWLVRVRVAGMRPDLTTYADRQQGLVTRRQAMVAGYEQHEVRRLTSPTGPWVVVRRGVYIERDRWDALGPYDARPALRDRAAQLAMTVPHVLSHDSAGRAHGLPMLRPVVELSHVTRPGVGGSRTRFGVKHHLSQAMPPIVEVEGLHVTGLARVALDLGREHGFAAGVVACDAAMRRGVTRAELEQQLEGMWCWPGITRSREAVVYADPGAETVGESLSRLMLDELGLGPVETQFAVRLPSGTVWCDMRIGCHVFEFDGRVKYRPPAEGGVADRPSDEVVWEEKKRERLVRAEGLGVSRIIWEDLWGAARERTKDRLRAEYRLTAERFGTALPGHLAAYSRRMRALRVPS